MIYRKRVINLNTSHVNVNLKMGNLGVQLPIYLNTSHVNVNLQEENIIMKNKNNLNTSHVNVNRILKNY